MIPPIFQLRVGQIITPRLPINKAMASNWRYASECSDFGSVLPKGTELKIVEINTAVPGNHWLKAEIAGSWGTRLLKLWGGELSSQFELKR